MINLPRTSMIQLFSEMRNPSGYLTRMFTVKPGGQFNGSKVAIDIQRFGEDVAIVVKKCTGPNLNDFDEFTTKEFTPPAYGEAFPLDVCELLNRMAGVDPFTAAYADYTSQLVAKMFQGFQLIDAKIQRGIELQASQILQTGRLTLPDADGNTLYELDFAPKATHFPTVTTDWSDTGADILGDLSSLAGVIRADGKVEPDRIIVGDTALKNMLANDGVQAALDNLRIDVGMVAPEMVDSGATFYGYVWVGTSRMQIWAYPETYTDPQTNLPVPYIGTDNVVMLSTRTRLDMASARVALPLGPDPRVAGLLPGRMTSREGGFDVTPNVYPTPNGKQIMGELESITLLIPVQIDGFACIKTKA